jgi:uncharacterized protein involved in exopolysaccharide biosynthesis
MTSSLTRMPDEDLIRRGIQPPAPTVRELAMVLFRQRKVFVWVSGIVLVAAILYAIAGTKYEAKMTILVRHGRADAPVSAQENAPVDLTRLQVTEEELNSEVELLRDDEVLRKVVEASGRSGRDWFYVFHIWDGPAQQVERAARRLAKKLNVEATKKTNLITVSYAADDPQRAAKILQLVANAYLEKHTAVHRPTGEYGFFDQQKSESRLQLEEAKGKLLAFTERHGVVEAAQQRDLALQKLSEIDATHRQTQIDLAETARRVMELEGQLAKLPERTTTQVRISDNPDLMRAMKSSLLDLQLKRTELLTKFEPTHRLVQEVDKQIQQAESAIAAEILLPLRDETTDKNTHYEWAKSELQSAQVQLKALESRERAEATQESSYRNMAQQLGEDAVTQDELASTEKAAQDNYLLYIKKQEEARIDDALDQRGIVNVAIAQQPVAPALPLWSGFMVLAVGAVVAGVSGTGAAFTADYFDPAFRNPDDVLLYLNAPVLASLPKGVKGNLSA